MNLRDPAEDLRYLLARGYQRSSAVRFVGDRYNLAKQERLYLYRCVYPESTASLHSKKCVPPDCVKGTSVSIDGFNVLRTVNGALRGAPVFVCDDGFVRDISVGLKRPSVEELIESLEIVTSVVAELRPAGVTFVYDRPVSRSGMISKRTGEMMGEKGIRGSSLTSLHPDTEVLSLGEVVATSDSVVIQRAKLVFDLAGYIIMDRLCIRPTKI
ncbi:MAG: DUF434 domain-containing protein [Candidatus Verstraetearchaeota archaeon]|nr:DUF434 domain-containing protein [Candidatus Verstraetearchaeota archaeon]